MYILPENLKYITVKRGNVRPFLIWIVLQQDVDLNVQSA